MVLKFSLKSIHIDIKKFQTILDGKMTKTKFVDLKDELMCWTEGLFSTNSYQ